MPIVMGPERAQRADRFALGDQQARNPKEAHPLAHFIIILGPTQACLTRNIDTPHSVHAVGFAVHVTAATSTGLFVPTTAF